MNAVAVVRNSGFKKYSGTFNVDFSATGSASVTVPHTAEIESGETVEVKCAVTIPTETKNVTVSAKLGSDKKEIALQYIITPKTSDFKFTKPNDLTYDGNAKTVTVTSDKSGMGDVTVKYYNESGVETDPINAGKYTVKIDVAEGTDYLAKTDLTEAGWTFTISPKDIANANITLGESLTYNGTEQTQTISSVAVDGLILTEDDYTVSGNKGTEAKDDYVLAISGKGNFTGTATKTFAIAKADSQTTTTANATVTYGETLTLTATVEKSARTLNKVDFYVVEGENEELLGTADVTYTDGTHGTATLTINTTDKKLKIGDNKITADYGGSVNLNGGKGDTITVTLKQKTVGLTWNDYETLVYDGNAKNVTATATGIENGDGEIIVGVVCGDETNAGTYTAQALNLTGTNAKYYKLSNTSYNDVIFIYTISPKPVTATISDIDEQTYTGSAITPQITAYDGTTEIPTSEYTVEYKDNVNAGTATVTLTDKADGNYVVGGNKTFTIAKKAIDGATLALDGELTYNGQEQTQNVTLTIDGFANVTFDISDNKQTNVKPDGDYTLTVTGTGNFEGEKTLDWNIKPATPTKNDEKPTTANVLRDDIIAKATVKEGEMLGIDGGILEGTYAWADENTIANGDITAQMIFTPNDTNYKAVTIDVDVSTYTYSSGGGSATRYTVKFNTNGGSEIENQTVSKNGYVQKPTDPTKEGYAFGGWYTGESLATSYNFNAKVTNGFTLYAKWIEDELREPNDDKKDDEQKTNDDNTVDEPQTSEWENPFADVFDTDWYFDSVKYVNKNGLMSGMTNTTFAPNDSLTRAMLVTVLWRTEGEPATDFAMPFTDVDDTAYYADAVRWAASENIVKGITETEFAPNMNITREQIAAIIYRYAKYKGYNTSVGEDTNILSYADFDEISEYAIEAVQYAVGSGLMKGKTETTLNPKDNATRAEISVILQRIVEGNK